MILRYQKKKKRFKGVWVDKKKFVNFSLLVKISIVSYRNITFVYFQILLKIL